MAESNTELECQYNSIHEDSRTEAVPSVGRWLRIRAVPRMETCAESADSICMPRIESCAENADFISKIEYQA